jgi:transposase-like protein
MLHRAARRDAFWLPGGGTPQAPRSTRVGKLELRVPQDRHGRFSTELFERYQRSEWNERSMVEVLRDEA